MSEEPKQSELFQGLILSLAAAVMQHMGKTLNPMTQKVEKNMTAAQSTIDMLDMLEAKTKGNLSEAEAKLMTHVLAELKMNYVETLNEKPEASTEAAKPVEDGTSAKASGEPAASETPGEPAAPEEAQKSEPSEASDSEKTPDSAD